MMDKIIEENEKETWGQRSSVGVYYGQAPRSVARGDQSSLSSCPQVSWD